MDSGSSGLAAGIGDPDDDHPNPVGDKVIAVLRRILTALGPLGQRLAGGLPTA